MKAIATSSYLAPMANKGKGSSAVNILLVAGTIFWLYYCIRILALGLTTFGINTYGAIWGILVANTIHIIGISHVGIAISAAVRLLNLKQYRAIARIAEFITLIALVMALINLFLHVGRPDRFILNVFLYGKWHSPMVWSMTVFVLYFLTSSVYLYLSMRKDLWNMAVTASRFKGFYQFLTFGYQDTEVERTRHNSVLFWLASALIPIMISVHSVYGLLFGMISAQAGWYNPLQAPYFVLGAIVSGFSAILVVAAILRRVYSWQNLLTERLFRVFGIFLTFMVFLYLYFMLSEHLTAQYLPTVTDGEISDSLLTGRFSPIFWLTTLAGLVIPFGYLLVQSVKKNYIHIGLTAIAAVFINIALWLKRSLLVVPSQYHSHLLSPRQLVEYTPTFTEWAVVLGSYIVAALVFYYLLRIFPMIELPEQPTESGHQKIVSHSSIRTAVMIISLVAGLSLIAWGMTTIDNDYTPIKWLAGIVFILAIPLSYCIIPDGSAVLTEGANPTQAQNGQISKGDNNE